MAQVAPEEENVMIARDAACPAQFVELDGKQFEFHVEGPADAAVVVLLHGSMMCRKYWIFPNPRKDLRLVAISRPGYGESAEIDPRKYGYEVLVSVVSAVLKQLSVDTFHVIGHSGGGPCALAVKAMIPECQRCVVLAGESEYYSNPKVDDVGCACLVPPGGVCGSCGHYCCLPVGVRQMTGTCCAYYCCCKSYKGPSPLKRQPSEAGMQMISPQSDFDQVGDHRDDWLAYTELAFEEGSHGGFKINGAICDIVGPKKPWPFKAALTDGTVKGADVDIVAGELDLCVKMHTSEWTHTLVPGSNFHIAKGVGHCGVAFPKFMQLIFAALAGGHPIIMTADAPQQTPMD